MSDEYVEIRVEGLHKSFDGHAVLKGVDLAVGRGEMVAIVGGSGCGKTVLLNHILGLLAPDAGRVLVADHGRPGAPLRDIAELEEGEIDRIHTHYGVVFQRNALFSGSVLDNISLWLREVRNCPADEVAATARRVLESVALPTTADFLESPVEGLSGGMAKRLAIARALSMDPAVMFHDEPTTGLDPNSASQVQDLILATHRAAAPSRTTVIVTHDKDLLTRLEPRIVMLHDGRVFFDGAFSVFAASSSPVVRPYFDLMPVLHGRRHPGPEVAP
jgi:phospholipid/cholesterol/gamma-HCH transport system ATP-binding protein